MLEKTNVVNPASQLDIFLDWQPNPPPIRRSNRPRWRIRRDDDAASLALARRVRLYALPSHHDEAVI
jgi:hypothetical protein